MSEIKTWQERVASTFHLRPEFAMQAEITELRAALAERDAELTKAQDELNCTEVELEVAACDMPEEKFNQGFECMGDFVRAVSEGYKAALAERDAEIERLTTKCQDFSDYANVQSKEGFERQRRYDTLSAAAQQGLDALIWTVEQGGGPACEHEAGVCFCKENAAINSLTRAIAKEATNG